ncbi:hypothetical protein TrispH2_002487 [Trichoplax sp. H2]|nr:hypothetical protein TrispH2_002487 [Trichoplax sp. H2]|eukprot:RDD45168.1 hypothetical protein TrispH2_002487 [Trichoplax sp. H2]
MTLMDAFRSFLGLDEHKWNPHDIRNRFENEFNQNLSTLEEEFENQMRMADEMLKGLFSNRFSFQNPMDAESGQPESFIFYDDGNNQQNNGNLRDHVLKPESKNDRLSALPPPIQQHPPSVDGNGIFPKIFRFNQEKQDIDYDESVQDNRHLLKGLIGDESNGPTDLNRQPKSWFSSNSISFSTITKPDGSSETKRVERNSNGDEEITVTQSFGDQSYTYKKRIKADGSSEINEDFVNVDQDKMSEIRSKFFPKHLNQGKLKDSVMKESTDDRTFKSILFPKLVDRLFDD